MTQMTISGNDSPQVERKGKAVAIVEIGAEQLADLIDRVLPFASTDSARPNLNAVRFEVSGATAIMVAVDGHRMVQVGIGLDVQRAALRFHAWAKPFRAVIPRAEAWKVRDALGRVDGACVATVTDRDEMRVVGGGPLGPVAVSVPLSPPASFPPWREVLPKKRTERVLVGRLDFMAAMRRGCECRKYPHSKDHTEPASVSLVLSERAMSVRVENNGGPIDLPVRYRGSSRICSFNPKYLLDAAASTSARFIALEFDVESYGPCTIRDADESPDFVAVIMGVRI